MRGPYNCLIALLLRALRWLLESWRCAALRDHHTGNIWRRWHFESHWRWLVRRDAGLALGPHSGILKHDSIDDRRDIARQIRQAHPIDPVAQSSIVDDGLPLHEPRRWRLHRAA